MHKCAKPFSRLCETVLNRSKRSQNANHLAVIGQPSGLEPVGKGGRLHNGSPITGTNAAADPLFVGGHAVYSACFEVSAAYFIPDSRTYSVLLFLKRQCDQTLGRHGVPQQRDEGHAHGR